MKRSIIITLHVAYWLMFVFFSISTSMVSGNVKSVLGVQSFFLNAFLAGSCFYTFYFVLVPKFLATRKLKQFVISAIGTCITSAVIIIALTMLLAFLADPQIEEAPVSLLVVNWGILLVFHAILGMVHGALASFMRGFFTWYDEIHLKEVLEKKNMEIQMSLIKARINPHFLFNTLNNIDVLIKTSASSASLYLQKLCNIMRYALYENQGERIMLEKELGVMREYIELESIRTANKDFVSFEVNGDPGDVVIAPMLFIPFLENAFKHSGRKVSHGIVVKIGIIDRTIHFECRNNVIEKQPLFSEGGLGIHLMKARLNLLYPDKHRLVLQNENDYFEVDLTVEAA